MDSLFDIHDILAGRMPSISVEQLMPPFYGLSWGISYSQAAEILGDSVIRQRLNAYLVVRGTSTGAKPDVVFRFHKGTLFWITAEIYISQSFWPPEENPPTLMEELYKQLIPYYERLAEHYTEILGPPAFSGNWTSPGYPKGILATPLTMWNLPEGSFLVEFDHSDKEVPMIVRLSSRALQDS